MILLFSFSVLSYFRTVQPAAGTAIPRQCVEVSWEVGCQRESSARSLYKWFSFFFLFTCGTSERVQGSLWILGTLFPEPCRCFPEGSPRPSVHVHPGGIKAESLAGRFPPCGAADHCGPVLAMPLSSQDSRADCLKPTCSTQKSNWQTKPTHQVNEHLQYPRLNYFSKFKGSFQETSVILNHTGRSLYNFPCG